MDTNPHESETDGARLVLKDEVYQLRTTRLRVGVILNFKHAKLESERIVL